MRRRDFAIMAAIAAGWPSAGHAQRQTTPAIGFIGSGSPGPFAPYVAELHQGLRETGYVEGQNLKIEYHWAEGHYDRLPGMIAGLIDRKVQVIVATGPSALVAKKATSTIPVVFAVGRDPVAFGLVDSLARPGGNVTGITSLTIELMPKMLELILLTRPSNK